MNREAEIQDALKDLIEGLIAKKFRFDGLEVQIIIDSIYPHYCKSGVMS